MSSFEDKLGLQTIRTLVETDSNLSRIYGFILYTRADAFVVKVLQDDVFWNALDERSGSRWPVFAVRPLQKGNKVIRGGGKPGSISMLIPVWDEPQANIPILQELGLSDSEELPLFVVFMWDDSDILHKMSIPIKGDSIDSVYNSIDEIISTISRTEEKILPQYKATESVFREVSENLSALKLKFKILQAGKILAPVADFLSLFL